MQPRTLDPTPTQRLASLYLKQDVCAWIEGRRAEGIAWRWIARELTDATNGAVDVTPESVRTWAKAASDAV